MDTPDLTPDQWSECGWAVLREALRDLDEHEIERVVSEAAVIVGQWLREYVAAS